MIDRTQGLGASDSPVVYGCSPYMRPLQLWRLKRGLDQPETATKAMEEGNRWEPFIREAAEDEYRMKFVPELVQPEPWHWSQLDGANHNKDGAGTILECKYTTLGAHEMALNPPMHWRVQLAHQIHDYKAVYGKRPAVLLAVGDGIGTWFNVPDIDCELIARVYGADQEFWRLVQDGTPPLDTAYRDDDDWRRAAEIYLECKEAADHAKSELELARSVLEALAGGSALVHGCGVTVRWKSRTGGLDAAEMARAGIEVERYRKESSMYQEVRKG